MNGILISLGLGGIAGAIDVAPMKKRGIPKQSLQATFAQWLLLGLVIPHVAWGIHPALKGMILGFLGMCPSMIQLTLRNPKAIVPTGFAGAVLGAGIGYAGSLLVN